MPTLYTLSDSSHTDPFIIEPLVSAITRRRAPSNPVPTDDDDDYLRPYLYTFRLDPFSTHDGVHGRPVPSAIPVSYSQSQTRPILLEFQLDLPGQVGDSDTAPSESAPVKEEHHTTNAHRSGRLIYPPDTQSMFSPHPETRAPRSNENLYSPPRLLYPIPEDPEERPTYDATSWAPATLRSPTEFPNVVVRSPERVFQPLAQRAPVHMPVPDQQSPMPASWPTSLAYHAGYTSDGSGSSESPASHANGYGYGSWDASGHSMHAQPSQPTTNGRPPMSAGQDYYGVSHPYRPQSQSQSQPQSFFQPQSHHHSFSHSDFDHPPQAHSQPGAHLNSYGQDVPAQPPVTILHQRSSAILPERFAHDRADNGTVSPLPRYLTKSRFISTSPSPAPTQLSPVASSRSSSLSPLSVASDHSSWGTLSSRHQRRLDLAPYIPAAARKLYGKGKEHTCKVCNKNFKRPSTLQTHMNTHTGEKPYFCPVLSCGRRFSVSSNLTRHLRTHGMDNGVVRGPRNKANKPSGNDHGPLADRRNTATEPWCPESLRGMRNAKELSHRPPFVMSESAVPICLPLPPVRPHGRVGDENFEERDSFIYAEDTKDLNPYHPTYWDLCPRLPGPLPSRSDKEQHERDRARAASAGFGGASARFGGWFGAHDHRA